MATLSQYLEWASDSRNNDNFTKNRESLLIFDSGNYYS